MRHSERSPERKEGVEAVDIDGEVVLWDPIRRQVHLLDPVGGLLWPLLDGETTLVELADDVAAVWDVPVTEVRLSLARLVEQLEVAGLLVTDDLAPPPPSHGDPDYLQDPPAP